MRTVRVKITKSFNAFSGSSLHDDKQEDEMPFINNLEGFHVKVDEGGTIVEEDSLMP